MNEYQKYRKMWEHDAYRRFSPGEDMIPLFRQMVKKKGSLIDLGCGTGRAGLRLAELGFEVTFSDFVMNCLDYAVIKTEPEFIKFNLCGRWPERHWDVGYCCDVMEHLPPDKVDKVLKQIRKHCRRTFFTIHFGPDNMGKMIGHPLHLTVRPFLWWREKLRDYGKLREARDLIGMGAFLLC